MPFQNRITIVFCLIMLLVIMACSSQSLSLATQTNSPQITQIKTTVNNQNNQSTPQKIEAPTADNVSTAASIPTAELNGKTLTQERCTACHGLGKVERNRTKEQWANIVTDMVNRGAQLNDAEQTVVLNYLNQNFQK